MKGGVRVGGRFGGFKVSFFFLFEGSKRELRYFYKELGYVGVRGVRRVG